MDKKEEYCEWLNYAANDYDTAFFLLNMPKKPQEIICYHCQQAAEKYLKAYLVFKDQQIEKTHNLVLRNNLCLKIDEEFKQINTECARLNLYSVAVRYPNNIETEEQDVAIAISYIEKIRKFVEDKITPHSTLLISH